MKREENVLRFYVLCNKLKDLVRKGWQDWHVERDRLESVADHIYGTTMLAVAIKDQYEYDIDITKVIMMLAIHELEEVLINDITIFDMPKQVKKSLGREAVSQMLKDLIDKDKYHDLINEFENCETPEAKFAHMCDKLECDIQCKLYDEEGCISYDRKGHVNKKHLVDNVSANHPDVVGSFNNGDNWSEMWMKFWQKYAGYDDNFMEVSNYAMNNDIAVYKKEKLKALDIYLQDKEDLKKDN